MFCRSCSPGRDNGDVDRIHTCPRQFALETAASSVPVDRREQYFARSALLGLTGPGHGLASRRLSASSRFNSEGDTLTVADPESLNNDNYRRETGGQSNPSDQSGISQGRGIDRNLVSPGVEYSRRIVQRSNAPAHGEG